MIRYFYQMLDFLGSIFALLSPISILHWLIEATQEKTLVGLVQWLDPFFHPINSIFEPLFRMVFTQLSGITINPILSLLNNLASMIGMTDLIPSELPYDLHIGSSGQIVPITQGLLGLCFTILFFLCSFGSQMLRALEQRMDVSHQDAVQRRRLEQLKAEQKKTEQRISTNKHVMVSILCNFQKNENTANCFEQLCAKHKGEAREVTPDAVGIEFRTTEQALKYCVEAAQNILKYYSGLRPIDPQPPFRIGIHPHDTSDRPETTITYCKALGRYAGENQIVLSDSTKQLLDALKQADEYNMAPLGAYYLEGVGAQELYRLIVR